MIAALRQFRRISDESAFHIRLGEVLTYLHKMNCSQMLEYLQDEYLGTVLIYKNSMPNSFKLTAAKNQAMVAFNVAFRVVMSTSMLVPTHKAGETQEEGQY